MPAYQVFPLTPASTPATNILNLPSMASLAMNGGFIEIDGSWPNATERPSASPEANITGQLKFDLPFIRFTGVDGGVDQYTVWPGYRVLQAAPTIDFSIFDEMGSVTIKHLGNAISALKGKSDETPRALHSKNLELVLKEIFRMVTNKNIGPNLLGLFNTVLESGHLTGIDYKSNGDIVFDPAVMPLQSARILTGLAKAGRLVLLEPASIDLFSDETANILKLADPNGSLTSVRTDANPAGAVISGGLRMYGLEDAPIRPIDTPILAIVGNLVPEVKYPKVIDIAPSAAQSHIQGRASVRHDFVKGSAIQCGLAVHCFIDTPYISTIILKNGEVITVNLEKASDEEIISQLESAKNTFSRPLELPEIEEKFELTPRLKMLREAIAIMQTAAMDGRFSGGWSPSAQPIIKMLKGEKICLKWYYTIDPPDVIVDSDGSIGYVLEKILSLYSLPDESKANIKGLARAIAEPFDRELITAGLAVERRPFDVDVPLSSRKALREEMAGKIGGKPLSDVVIEERRNSRY